MKLLEFFERYHPKLLTCLHNRGYSLEDAEDALQSALVRALEDRQLLLCSDFAWYSWLTTTAANLLTDQCRHESALERVSLLYLESSASQSSASQSSASQSSASQSSASRIEADFTSAIEFNLLFREAWTRLKEQEAQLLRLRQEGYSCEEIATQKNITVENVKKLLQRARAHLQEELIERDCGYLFTEKRVLPRIKKTLE